MQFVCRIGNNFNSTVNFSYLKVSIPGDRFFLNRVLSVISVVRRETTISVSTDDPASMESQIVQVISINTTEISYITQLKIRS